MVKRALATVRVWMGPSLRLGYTLAIAATLAAVCQFFGVVDAVTRLTDRAYYQQRGARTISSPVMLVRIDDETFGQWGAAPWSWQRLQSLLQPILDDRPTAVAMLDAGPLMLPPTAPPAQLRDAIDHEVLLLPDSRDWRAQSSIHLDDSGALTIELFGEQQPSIASATGRLMMKLRGISVAPALRVNLTTSNGVPTISALHVVGGNVPKNLFRDRIVVIGMAGHFAPNVISTVMGNLSPAEVVAQAIHAVASNNDWYLPPIAVQLIVIGLVMIGIIAACSRARRSRTIAIIVLVALVGVVAIGYLLFCYAIAVDTGMAVVAGVSAGLSALLVERSELRRRIASTRAVFSSTVVHQHDPQSLITRFQQAGARFLQSSSSLWAALPDGQWHVELRNASGPHVAAVVENRRDIRRQPWSSVHVDATALVESTIFQQCAGVADVTGAGIEHGPADGHFCFRG
jgi:hypothetical protein